MNELIEKIQEMPKSQRLMIWGGTLVFFTFVFWQYFYSSALEEHEKLSTELSTLETKIDNEKRLARDIGKARERLKDLEVKLKMALAQLPEKKEIPDLLNNISNLARDAGLEVSLFKPREENMKEFYAEVPVQISVQGAYHQVASFFDEVGGLPRIVNISQIGFTEPTLKESGMLVRSDCVATTFRYLDDKERIKSTPESGKGRRR
jgi:type IV pilus assembly protein PilO